MIAGSFDKAQAKIFKHRKTRHDASVLWNVCQTFCEALPGLKRQYFSAFEQNQSCPFFDETHDRMNGRALAGAISTQ